MSDIKIFSNNEFGEIRTVIIDGEAWFVSKDISDKLGYSKPANMVKLIDEDDKRNIQGSVLEPSAKTPYKTSVINESGLYAAIFGSKQENAKKFKKWVTSEVLPSIRKTGEYKQENAGDVQGQIKLLAQGTTELYEKVEAVTEDVKSARNELKEFKETLPLLPEDADEISDLVKKRGVEILGGKQSPAYNDRGLRMKLYVNFYSNLKYNFKVRTYKAIKRNQKAQALQIIEKYEPPFFLAQQIESMNEQRSLDLEGGGGDE